MNDDGKTVAAMDILAPGIEEIVVGSQREERLNNLLDRIKLGIFLNKNYGGSSIQDDLVPYHMQDLD